MRYRFQSVTHSPESDEGTWLDQGFWLEARCLKARRNWSPEYNDCLFQLFGHKAAYLLLMRGKRIRFTHELKHDVNIEGCDAKAIAAFLCDLQQACGQDVQLSESVSSPGFSAFARAVRHRCERGPVPCHFRVRRHGGAVDQWPHLRRTVSDGVTELWEVREPGKWLWWRSVTLASCWINEGRISCGRTTRSAKRRNNAHVELQFGGTLLNSLCAGPGCRSFPAIAGASTSRQVGRLVFLP
ncbi:hypothetical protein [Bradyrhizobium cenepequi]|uniref:hypothetical protein n=1 Tax=Bradyrhizobium cenepequi TaxID=2821403 RepID=UPI001CE38492|nr:hypothetical protein [Bradyrhizobium cenepequi]MCA6112220.1 hypothetical protein [Bradyrhizobium cenepequi]